MRARLVGFLVLLSAMGCRTIFPPLPPANLKEPGWTVHEGQAVWRLAQGTREIAGDVLVATRQDGETFVQFSKTPFPLVTARTCANRWQVELSPQNKYYAGRGQPPTRLIWLYLPRVLAGQPPPRNWSWQENPKGWRLENRASGESVDGYFNQ
jgi:hypothetical protein